MIEAYNASTRKQTQPARSPRTQPAALLQPVAIVLEVFMQEKRVTVWVQRFKDRSTLMLQWIDPDTGRRKSKSAETAEPKKAEEVRIDLESDLNNGRHREQSQMSWK